ncbi:hypothetical protein BT96DRAFT_1001624 [Gymnopus androsaceus JB14]|uniref:F-box domain-containing protein n=1 Tax=Gymnopus androsaceus JB14 TaxID=1447944 RepID=A0A6A4H196_9AGAR|nr:hypothetical protein BT96DRAFT_1001624 [Gymnopus androsaceus JB14]
MNHVSGFDFLPNEIYLHILQGIPGDTRTLNALTQISKRCHDFFNSVLYENVPATALRTLSLSEQDRLPLTGPHPASYVKKLSVSPPGVYPVVLKEQMIFAMRNVTLYASSDGIQSFAFCCFSISLPEVFGDTIPLALRFIKELSLRFSLKNSLTLACSLCGSSLTRLELDFGGFVALPDFHTLATFIKHLPSSSRNLNQLSLRLPDSKSHKASDHYKVFTCILSDEDFVFPLLTDFSYNLQGVDLRTYKLVSKSIPAFFQRHPQIEALHYDQPGFRLDPPNLEPLTCPGILPQLRRFEGLVEDAILLLCKEGGTSPTLEQLVLTPSNYSSRHELAVRVRDALATAPFIRKLYLQDPFEFIYAPGYSSEDILAITNVCPGLIHFECVVIINIEKVDIANTLNVLYKNILGDLPRLVYLKLSIAILPAAQPGSLEDPHRTQRMRQLNKLAIVAAMSIHSRTSNELTVHVYERQSSGSCSQIL